MKRCWINRREEKDRRKFMSFFEKKHKIIVPVVGATTGLTVWEFSKDGAALIMDTPVPWLKEDNGAWYWPLDWLKNICKEIMKLAKPGDIVTMAIPGADLAIETDKGWLDAQHYQSIGVGYFNHFMDMSHMSRLEVYLKSGGANVAFFQPPAQLEAEVIRRGLLNLVTEIKSIVPLSDWITFTMTDGLDIVMLDQVMLQSQGLLVDSAKEIYEREFSQLITRALVNKPMFTTNANLTDTMSRLIIPVTHDSVPARMVGFSADTLFVIWTGSWVGTAISLLGRDDIVPSEKTYSANIVFEGIGKSRAAISNITMAGPIYKSLKAELSFDQMVEVVMDYMPRVKTFDLEEMPIESIKESCAWLCDKYVTPGVSATALIKTTALACYTNLKNQAEMLGLEDPCQVAIIGGWAENRAFKMILEKLGLKVVIPPLAKDATHVGLAAEALVRTGNATNTADALNQLVVL